MEDKDTTCAREDPQPNSLSPVQLEASRAKLEQAAQKNRRSSRLVITALCSGVVAFGIAQWVDKSPEPERTSAVAAEQIEAIEAQQATALLRCMLPEVQRTQITDHRSLHAELELASERAQKAYGKQLGGCASLSEDLAERIDAIAVPADLAQRFGTLRGTAGEVVQALATYQRYLIDPERPYDFSQASPLIERIAIAWTSYEDQRVKLNQALRAHP